MKKLTICVLILLAILAFSGCISLQIDQIETPPFELALNDCNVTIQDRITGEVYYTARPYFMTLGSSRIKIEEGYKVVRNSFGGRIGTEPLDTPIILSGNWSLTEG